MEGINATSPINGQLWQARGPPLRSSTYARFLAACTCVRHAQPHRCRAEAAHESKVETGSLDEACGQAVVAAGALQQAAAAAAEGERQRHTAAASSLLRFCTLKRCSSAAAGWQNSPKRSPALQSRTRQPHPDIPAGCRASP